MTHEADLSWCCIPSAKTMQSREELKFCNFIFSESKLYITDKTGYSLITKYRTYSWVKKLKLLLSVTFEVLTVVLRRVKVMWHINAFWTHKFSPTFRKASYIWGGRGNSWSFFFFIWAGIERQILINPLVFTEAFLLLFVLHGSQNAILYISLAQTSSRTDPSNSSQNHEKRRCSFVFVVYGTHIKNQCTRKRHKRKRNISGVTTSNQKHLRCYMESHHNNMPFVVSQTGTLLWWLSATRFITTDFT